MWTGWTRRIIFLHGLAWTDKQSPKGVRGKLHKRETQIPSRVVPLCSLGLLHLALKAQDAARVEQKKSHTSVLRPLCRVGLGAQRRETPIQCLKGAPPHLSGIIQKFQLLPPSEEPIRSSGGTLGPRQASLGQAYIAFCLCCVL